MNAHHSVSQLPNDTSLPKPYPAESKAQKHLQICSPCLHIPSHPIHPLVSLPISSCIEMKGRREALCDITQQFRLKNELPLLILLTRLKRLIVLPPHRLIALPARNIPHDVPAGCHVAFRGIAGCDVYDAVEEVSFAVLAPEVLGLS